MLIKRIKFGEFFNQSLKNLPLSVTHLTVGDKFNQIMDFPSSVTHLTIHNYKLIDKIPKTVTHLKLKCHFCMLINVPSSVTHLFIINKYSQIEGKIPYTVTHLTILSSLYEEERIPSEQRLSVFGLILFFIKKQNLPKTTNSNTFNY